MTKARAMAEERWLASCSDHELLRDLQQHRTLTRRPGAKRKLRLLSAAFARTAWEHITDSACRGVIEQVEQYADGRLKRSHMSAVSAAAEEMAAEGAPAGAINLADDARIQRLADHHMWSAARWASDAGGAVNSTRLVAGAVTLLVCFRTMTGEGTDWHTRMRAAEPFPHLVRCLFGNPFRPVAFAPGWNTSAVVGLADAIYDGRSFDTLPILADALEDAGCDDPDVLSHCRTHPHHARGCWVLDGIRGRGLSWA